MGNKEKVLDILRNNRLSVKDISERTNLGVPSIHTYLSRLIQGGKVKKLGIKDGRFDLYTANPTIDTETLLKSLYRLMVDKMIPKKPLDKTEFELIKQVETIK